jgi:hypothetical protein
MAPFSLAAALNKGRVTQMTAIATALPINVCLVVIYASSAFLIFFVLNYITKSHPRDLPKNTGISPGISEKYGNTHNLPPVLGELFFSQRQRLVNGSILGRRCGHSAPLSCGRPADRTIPFDCNTPL